jgi:hypothetical protein
MDLEAAAGADTEANAELRASGTCARRYRILSLQPGEYHSTDAHPVERGAERLRWQGAFGDVRAGSVAG